MKLAIASALLVAAIVSAVPEGKQRQPEHLIKQELGSSRDGATKSKDDGNGKVFISTIDASFGVDDEAIGPHVQLCDDFNPHTKRCNAEYLKVPKKIIVPLVKCYTRTPGMTTLCLRFPTRGDIYTNCERWVVVRRGEDPFPEGPHSEPAGVLAAGGAIRSAIARPPAKSEQKKSDVPKQNA